MIFATNRRTYVRSFPGQQDAQEANTLLAMQSSMKPEIKSELQDTDPAGLLCLDQITNPVKALKCDHSDSRAPEKFSWHDMLSKLVIRCSFCWRRLQPLAKYIDESPASKLASLTDSKSGQDLDYRETSTKSRVPSMTVMCHYARV